MTKNPHIALLLMCKNETKRIHVTLESVVGTVSSVVAFDTGSEDDTVDILKAFSKKHNIPLRLKQGKFVDFSTSRNVSLEFADSFDDIDYVLLLDVNDELRGGDKLKEEVIKYKDLPSTGFLVCQEWWSGQYDKYFNMRLVKTREGWRYRGRVHEWMKNTKYPEEKVITEKTYSIGPERCLIDLNSDFMNFKVDLIIKSDEKTEFEYAIVEKSNLDKVNYKKVIHEAKDNIYKQENKTEKYYLVVRADQKCDCNIIIEFTELPPMVARLPDTVVLYQDRTQDDDKSGKRFARDKELLLQDHKDNPTEPRTVFYLAQTCSCLGHIEDAYYYYKLRTTLDGFWEEQYHAYLRCGSLSESLKHDWYDSLSWYMKAFDHSERVESLIKIIEHYKKMGKWKIAFTFARLACELQYPTHCILFVDKHAYDYTRWHLMGIVGWYAGFYNEGKIGCLKAIDCGLNNDLDTQNLKFYTDREKELENKQEGTQQKITKNQFMREMFDKLSKENPNLNQKQLKSRANKLWKQFR